MKLLSLNISAYKSWQDRKHKIITLVQKTDPDIFFIQEARMDILQNPSGFNQLEEINQKLHYPYSVFSTTRLYENNTVQHGIGIISKHPVLNSKTYDLTPQKIKYDYSTRSYIDLDIMVNNDILAFTCVHFENTDEGALNHLKEVLTTHKYSNRKAIIIGDFNILDISQSKDLYGVSHECSYDYCKYVSFPEKSETLDYCLIPKNFSFTNVEVIGDRVSDHNALLIDLDTHLGN